jgi:hypothetical protein
MRVSLSLAVDLVCDKKEQKAVPEAEWSNNADKPNVLCDSLDSETSVWE